MPIQNWDPANRWVVYADITDSGKERIGAGGAGVTIMGDNDLKGLIGRTDLTEADGRPLDAWNYTPGRWWGGAAHEIGHSLGLPHPPVCDSAGAGAAACVAGDIMYLGYVGPYSATLRPEEVAALKLSPFFSASTVPPGNLNQFGWTGSWYNPATSGQGVVVLVYPDLAGAGAGLISVAWYTYDQASPGAGAEAQRWYVLSGEASGRPSTALTIYTGSSAGNFNAPPKIGTTAVGTATLSMIDCTHGRLGYSFDDGSGRVGSIPLTRLDANVTCAANGDNGVAASSYLLSGAWYDPETSGQGLLFDLNPISNGGNLAAGWYTYAPNASASGASASQRWYTLQAGFASGSKSADNVPIFTGNGGVFDKAGPVITTQVGTAKIAFSSCSQMRLSYHFSAGSNQGVLDGTIALQRLGPAPTGCAL